jgi:hypothetical protein
MEACMFGTGFYALIIGIYALLPALVAAFAPTWIILLTALGYLLVVRSYLHASVLAPDPAKGEDGRHVPALFAVGVLVVVGAIRFLLTAL